MINQPAASDGLENIDGERAPEQTNAVDEGWTDVLMMAGLIVVIGMLCALLT